MDIGVALRRKNLDWSNIFWRTTALLHDVALRVFAHVASAEKHVIVITERSFHRGFPLAVRMLADGGQFYNNFVLLKCMVKHICAQINCNSWP